MDMERMECMVQMVTRRLSARFSWLEAGELAQQGRLLALTALEKKVDMEELVLWKVLWRGMWRYGLRVYAPISASHSRTHRLVASRGYTEQAESQDQGVAESPERALWRHQVRQRAQKVFERHPQGHLAARVLWNEEKTPEVAKAFGVSAKKVYNVTARVRKELRGDAILRDLCG